MKSIIISGVSGFMGSNLNDYLKNNYNIIGLSRNKENNPNTLSYEDVYNEGLDDHFAFIHLAGKAHDLKNSSEEEDYFKVNTDLTIKLFDLFLESKCQTFIFMSTVKAAADKVDGVLTEKTISSPKTPYGKSKKAAEDYILSKKLPENKNVYILRPCMVHGPNNKGNLNLLYKLVNKNIPYPLGKFENKRSFLSVNNLCFIIKALIEQKPESGVYNIADDEAISTNELINVIAATLGKKPLILKLPKQLIHNFAKLGDILKLPLNSNKLQKLTENYVVSNQKIKDTLDVKLPYNTKQGLSYTIKSFNND